MIQVALSFTNLRRFAKFKADVQRAAKKKAAERQKEAQKREVESLNRKHLAGLRVVQKNLVYVIGLNPAISNDDLLQTLRGDRYFGQYGAIRKIVVSKAKHTDSAAGQSLGVYVTFANKEDAARCIQAVNGSMNGERQLRAQLGTTKYCSAYLRHETCTNKQCMFLHEPGDNDDSYSRQELSSMNGVNTQSPMAATSTSRRAPQIQSSIHQSKALAAAASHPMAREISSNGSDPGDGSALPSSASWGSRPHQRSRRGSHATASGSTASPAVSNAMPVAEEVAEEVTQSPTPTTRDNSPAPSPSPPAERAQPRPIRDALLVSLLRAIHSPDVYFTKGLTRSAELESYPPLFDEHGGAKRKAAQEQRDASISLLAPEPNMEMRSLVEHQEDEATGSGSLQLGGEPEDDNSREPLSAAVSRRPSMQVPIQRGINGTPFGPTLTSVAQLGNLSSINGRPLTQHQQAQLLALKSAQSPVSFMDQIAPSFAANGHNRQSSRFSFANEGSAGQKSGAKVMAQSAMLPGLQTQQMQYQTAMPGPPPGLKSAVTPPLGGMLGQGHNGRGAFGNGAGFNGSSKDNESILQDMLRARNAAGSAQSHDAGKREYMFPSFLQQYPSASSTPAPALGLGSLYGPPISAFHDFGPRQKKKGKKHRHANTSSSGGGGLVDLADPSILQARMQHQHQSNAGVGQGLFGGQAQGGYNNPSMMYGGGFSRW